MNAYADPIKRVCLIQVSDPHLFASRGERLLNVDTDASMAGVLAAVRKQETSMDLLLVTGDVAQDAHPTAYRRFRDHVQGMAPMVRALPGNHDDTTAFHDVCGDMAQPVTDLGKWRLVMLNSSVPGSNAGHLDSQQLDLLDQACRTADGRHVLVAVHHNPVPVGSLWLDTMMISNGHALIGGISRHAAVKGLLWGHVHQAFDSTWNFGPQPAGSGQEAASGNTAAATLRQLRLLACPATSVQFTPQSAEFSLDVVDPGYRRLWLYDDGTIETEVVRVPHLNLQPDSSSKGY